MRGSVQPQDKATSSRQIAVWHAPSLNPLYRIFFPTERKCKPGGLFIWRKIERQFPGRPAQREFTVRVRDQLNIGWTGKVCAQSRSITLDGKNLLATRLALILSNKAI